MEAEAEAEAEKNFEMEAEAEAEAKKILKMEAEAEAVQKIGASTSLVRNEKSKELRRCDQNCEGFSLSTEKVFFDSQSNERFRHGNAMAT